MAHFAELDENNLVINVVPTSDEFELNGEELNQQVTGNVWKRTSYNTINGSHILGGIPFRGNYAGIGYTYQSDIDAFVPPKPYASWTLDVNVQWQPSVAMPTDDKRYTWDEATTSWIEAAAL